MARGNPNIGDARRGRAKASTRMFISLTPEYGVTVDSYNVTLVKIYNDEKQGKVIPLGQRYYSSFKGIVKSLIDFKIPQDVITKYEERIRGIETSYEVGKIKVSFPEGFESDPSPFAEEEDE
jgi:hypothetical protein